MQIDTGTCEERIAQGQRELDAVMVGVGFFATLNPGKGVQCLVSEGGVCSIITEIGEERRVVDEAYQQDAPIAVVMKCTLLSLEEGRLYGLTESQYKKFVDMGVARAATAEELEAWRVAGGYEAYKVKPKTYTPPTYRELARYRRTLGLSAVPRNRECALRHLAPDRGATQ